MVLGLYHTLGVTYLAINNRISITEDELMDNKYEISSSLQSLLDHVEEQLGTTINLQRKQEAPRKGLLLDQYSGLSSRNVIVFSNSLKWMKEFSDLELKTKSKITRSTSIVDYVLTYNNGRMPETQSELDAALEKIPETVRSPYMNGNNEAVIEFNTVKLETNTKSDLKDGIEGDLRLYPPPPGIKAEVTGRFAVFTNLVNDIVESKDKITYLGFVLVILFLALAYRNIYAITPIVPIAAIVGWNAVAMYLMGLDYNPMTACLGSMTIGVAAEYTILVMERYIEEKEKTSDVIEALKNSVSKIGSAIMVSGLATFFGFSALILSTFPIISTFGLTTIIAVLFSLIGAIVVMPAILAFIDKIIHDLKDLED